MNPIAAGQDSVLILMATYNGEKYLADQLNSIAAQNFPNWELLVCDDGSQDKSLYIVSAFQNRYPDKVFVYDQVPVNSARDNFFRLLETERDSSYVAFCDQDDIWNENKLRRLVESCKDLETLYPGDPCLVYSDLSVVDADLETLHPSFMSQIQAKPDEISYKSLLTENAIPGCAMLFNRSLADLLRSRSFDSEKTVMHDWWIALVAATIGHIDYVGSPLIQYRQHSNNSLGTVHRARISFALSKLVTANRSQTLRTYAQSAALLDLYGDLMDLAVRDDVAVFATLALRPKAQRIALLIRNQLLKKTLSRRAYQLLRA